MNEYCEKWKKIHHKKWEIAQDAGNTKEAEVQMFNYGNYCKLAELLKEIT